MAIPKKFISLKNIIAKVYRDYQLQEEDRFIDMFEWGVEALEHIGTFEQLVTPLPYEIEIKFYKGELPLDLVYINQVSHNGFAMLPSTNSFGPMKTLSDNQQFPGSEGLSVNQSLIEGATYNGVEMYKKFPQESYKLENGYIKTSFEQGCILISYQALPMDNEGYPVIPDDVSFREAIYRYIIYKYLYPQYVMGKVSKEVYQDAEAKWYWYCSQAGAKAKMPDLATLESIKRSYLSLQPKPNQFRTFFEELKDSNLNYHPYKWQ